MPELSPRGRGEDAAALSGFGMPVPPATVSAAHLRASAASLAEGAAAGRIGASVADGADLAEIIRDLLAGQQHISTALARLASEVRDRQPMLRSGLVGREDLLAMAEVLAAAGAAAGYCADALEQSRPMVDALAETTDWDTHS